VAVVLVTRSVSGDWPMWRADAARSAVSPDLLPLDLHRHWSRSFEPPRPAWPASQPKIRFDESYEPIVADGLVFVGSMVSDRLSAYDLKTGEERWRFYADGPIRFAPVVWRHRLFFGSDDGFLYALDTRKGQLLWKQRGGPDGRRVLGNERLISTWPVRGAPVLYEEADGTATLYYGAGIWPFMGIFLHAVDPETGRPRWRNSGSGSIFVLQQHSSPAFAGVAPQGYLAVGGNWLLVSGGRTVPAGYDRRTGAFGYFDVASRAFGKDAGGYGVSVNGEFFFNHGCLFAVSNGAPVLDLKNPKTYGGASVAAVGSRLAIVSSNRQTLVLYSGCPVSVEEVATNRNGEEIRRLRYTLIEEARFEAPVGLHRVHVQAGHRLYASGDGGWIGAFDLSPPSPSGLVWEAHVGGEIWTLVPADHRLLAMTREGTLVCFAEGPPPDGARHFAPEPPRLPPPERLPGPDGYALLLSGEAAADRAMALAERFHVVVVLPDAEAADRLRRRWDTEGVLGQRIHVLADPAAKLDFPPYWVSWMDIDPSFSVRPGEVGRLAARLWSFLRPYGGTMEWRAGMPPIPPETLALWKAEGALMTEGADPVFGQRLRVVRAGSLPGSAPWTHQYADVANTCVSKDWRVRAPLGLLWFGGPSNDEILPRHGHGPSPQVVGGRLLIEGPDLVRAVDVYTGRLLWERLFPGLGRFYDNTEHQPGANEIGGNTVSWEDGFYIVYEKRCFRLDPVTGTTMSEFQLPRDEGDGDDPHWGYIGICGDVLLAGASPMAIEEKEKGGLPVVMRNVPYASSSLRLVALNRHSGTLLWQRRAAQSFRHNAIVAGANKVFCVDGLSAIKREMLKRRGEEPSTPATLYALDLASGQVLWKRDEAIFGTWLGYAEERDLLLEAGSPARDRAPDEASGRMRAWRGSDGTLLWDVAVRYQGKPLLHDDVIYTEGAAFELATGRPLERPHPLTGRPTPWRYLRHYGCNTPIAGQYLLLFRSAAAGFYDLERDGGTGNWGGFKSGCTANLIPADGVLSAPDYTRTCTCSYQNQCSLALVPMADVEMWTFQAFDRIEGPILRMGINFGAPGDWPAPDGTLWLEFPMVGGPGPELGVEVIGQVSWFRDHALERKGPARPVTASGFEGEALVRIPLHGTEPAGYGVRLYFAEPDETVAPGERLFDLCVQGETMERRLDIRHRAGDVRTGWVLEIPHLSLARALEIELRACSDSRRPPLLCGVELAAGGCGPAGEVSSP